MTSYSLDTHTVTKLLKKHPGNQRILDRFRKEIRRNSLFIMCPVVFYEIRRGLVIENAVAQLAAFENLAEAMDWKEFNAAIWERDSNALTMEHLVPLDVDKPPMPDNNR